MRDMNMSLVASNNNFFQLIFANHQTAKHPTNLSEHCLTELVFLVTDTRRTGIEHWMLVCQLLKLHCVSKKRQ